MHIRKFLNKITSEISLWALLVHGTLKTVPSIQNEKRNMNFVCCRSFAFSWFGFAGSMRKNHTDTHKTEEEEVEEERARVLVIDKSSYTWKIWQFNGIFYCDTLFKLHTRPNRVSGVLNGEPNTRAFSNLSAVKINVCVCPTDIPSVCLSACMFNDPISKQANKKRIACDFYFRNNIKFCVIHSFLLELFYC